MRAQDVDKRVDRHEDDCARRYSNIWSELKAHRKALIFIVILLILVLSDHQAAQKLWDIIL